MIVIKNKNIRNIFRIILPYFLIPITVIVGSLFFDSKKQMIPSLLIACLSLAFFVSGIEQKNIGSRRIVIVSIMTSLCIIGRFIPFFQPITALTIITAMYLGKESAFLVGASSAFLSNFYFGQGPWTPFQMLAFGFIGLLAGHMSKLLIKSRVFLIVYGVLSGILFSLIMDVWSTIMYNGTFTFDFYIASVVSAIPHTLLYAFSNFLFILLCAEPFGKKLKRIKIKYGI